MRIVLIFLLTIVAFVGNQTVYATASTIAKNGMVVSEHKLASRVGVDILKAGGNAVDAAVAVGYALAVVNPCCGNVGGGGFMVIHLANGKNIFLNFREKAPQTTKSNMFLDEKNQPIPNKTVKGYLAVAVPGTVLGLETALKKYGTMKREAVMAPAIQLAKEGYKISDYEAAQFSQYADDFKEQPNVAAIFLKDGKPYQSGDTLIQTDLANTLTSIAEKGPNAFYKGPIASAIVKASKKNGGKLSLSDFSHYHIVAAHPIQCKYRGYTILSASPPSSGGVTLCEVLAILKNFPLKEFGVFSANSVRVTTEALRYGFLDRNRKLGDPDFVQNPIKELLSETYTKKISAKIASSSGPTINSYTSDATYDLTDTTHYSIIDKSGNAVAVTYTLNGFFGARVIAGHTGFFLNNEMDDFETNPGVENKFGLVHSSTNKIQADKRPLSSMAPTIVLKDGKLFMVLGSPGGPRIISTVLLTLLNVLDYGMTIQDAADSPRFHYQAFPDTIYIEPYALTLAVQNDLTERGYHITPQHTWGAIEAILYDANTKVLHGANDRRRPDGAAVGY